MSVANDAFSSSDTTHKKRPEVYSNRSAAPLKEEVLLGNDFKDRLRYLENFRIFAVSFKVTVNLPLFFGRELPARLTTGAEHAYYQHGHRVRLGVVYLLRTQTITAIYSMCLCFYAVAEIQRVVYRNSGSVNFLYYRINWSCC